LQVDRDTDSYWWSGNDSDSSISDTSLENQHEPDWEILEKYEAQTSRYDHDNDFLPDLTAKTIILVLARLNPLCSSYINYIYSLYSLGNVRVQTFFDN